VKTCQKEIYVKSRTQRRGDIVNFGDIVEREGNGDMVKLVCVTLRHLNLYKSPRIVRIKNS